MTADRPRHDASPQHTWWTVRKDGDHSGMKRRELLLVGSGMAAAIATGLLESADPTSAQALQAPTKWQHNADVVVVGSGAAGLPAAIAAREAGASVLLVEAENDIGGHAITSGGNITLGGG